MFNLFIAARSASEVNVSSLMRERIHRAVRANDCRQDLFDEIEAETHATGHQQQHEVFTSTPAFKLCCLLLNHPSYRFSKRQSKPGERDSVLLGVPSANQSHAATGGWRRRGCWKRWR